MVFTNKADEDWYWPVKILYTSAFFTLFDQSLQMFFCIGLNNIRAHVGIVHNPKGGGTPHMKGVGMLVGNFELIFLSGRGPSCF